MGVHMTAVIKCDHCGHTSSYVAKNKPDAIRQADQGSWICINKGANTFCGRECRSQFIINNRRGSWQ